MSFLHLSLLAGLGAVSVPILLHLFGRSQPQLVDFPALRFVRETTQEQSMSWQLRHFLLLLLRVLLLAALVLALARPRIHSAMLGSVLTLSAVGICATLATLIAMIAFVRRRPASIWLTALVVAIALWLAGAVWGWQTMRRGPSVPSADQSAPVAAALIVDNGPTMSYRADNSERLEAAKEMGIWILDQLPPDSRVGILSGAPVGSLSLDPPTGKSQLKLIEHRGAHVDLLGRTRTALELVLANELERKEIYVVTDLASASWLSSQPELATMLNEYREQVLLQIIDVGSRDAINFRLGDPQPDLDTVPAGGEVVIEIDVYRTVDAPRKSLTVELIQEQIDPRLPVVKNDELQVPSQRVVDRQVADLSASDSAKVQLRASNLDPGTHNFTIRLDQPDPLMVDNERYLSIRAQAQQPTLIVADDDGIAQNLKAIVDPSSVANVDGTETRIDAVRFGQLDSVQLENYAVICLFDPSPLTASLAQSLDQHVRGGGGLFVIMGPGLGTLERADGNPLTDLLPGKLGPIAIRPSNAATVYPEPVALSHPVFFAFGESPDQVLWNLFPVYRNWTFESLAGDAQTLMKLSDGSAGFLIGQNRGRGQILTLTSPIPEVESRDRDLWNVLWVSDPLPAFALLLGSFRTLSGANQEQLNYEVGQLVNLPNDSRTWPSRYDLFPPQPPWGTPVPAVDGQLSLPPPEQAGIYRLRGQRGGPIARAFSVNVPAADTLLARIDSEQLDEQLGSGNYRVARDRDEVQSSVGQARFGRELYPLLMVLVAGLFLGEQAMSNRFYKIKLGRTANKK